MDLSGILKGGASLAGGALPKAALGIGTGILQSIQAKKLKGRSDSAFPDLVDPSQAAFLSEIGQKRKSIDTGAAFEAGMQNIDATQAGTNDAITRASGGDTGSTMQALLQGQRVAGDSKNAVLAQGQSQQLAYTQMYRGVLDQISARKLQLEMQRSQQLKAEWAAKQKIASQNLMTGVSGLVGMLGGNQKNQKQTAAPQTTDFSAQPQFSTPESAGISNNTTAMGGVTDITAPTTSAAPSFLSGLTELTMKK